MDTQQVSDKFRKREFVVEVQSGQYFEFIKFQLTQDKCALADALAVGQEVTVHFNLRGKPYVKDGKDVYFNNLDAWRIEVEGSQTAPVTAPKPTPKPTVSPVEQMYSANSEDDLPFWNMTEKEKIERLKTIIENCEHFARQKMESAKTFGNNEYGWALEVTASHLKARAQEARKELDALCNNIHSQGLKTPA